MPVSRTSTCSITASPAAGSSVACSDTAPLGVNLTALPSRFSSDLAQPGFVARPRRRAPPVPLRARGRGPWRWPAGDTERRQASRHCVQIEAAPAAASARRASILAKSSTSLTIVSSAAALASTASRYSRCSPVRSVCQRQRGHAHDAVERRPQLVAHVGEELILGAARVYGARLLDRELGVERGQARRHLVERHRHRHRLGAATHRHPPRPVALGDLVRRFDDVAQRPRRPAAEHGGAADCEHERAEADQQQPRLDAGRSAPGSAANPSPAAATARPSFAPGASAYSRAE